MDKYSVAEIIEQAVQTEKLGAEFYASMAKQYNDDEQLREFFNTMYIKEQEHERSFSDLKGNIDESMLEGWEEASMYLRAVVESEFFLGSHKSLPSLEHLKTIEDALRYAIGFERETLLYYYSLRDIMKETEIIDKIINEEKSHILWLKEFREKLPVA